MALAEPADELGQRIRRQRRQRAERQRSGSEPGDVGNRRLRGLDVPLYLARRSDQRGAGRRQADVVPDALKQLDAELVFELLDRQRERRLRGKDRLGGAGEAAMLRNGKEVADLAEIH